MRFRDLLDTPGPFVSVYFADSDDTDDMEFTPPDLNWRTLREANRASREGTNRSSPRIEYAFMNLRSPIGRGGRAVVAGRHWSRTERTSPATALPSTVVRVSQLPYILPILEHGFEHYLLVVVDPKGAFITTHSGATRRSEAVDG